MPWRHSTAATEEILLITALSGLVAPQDFLALVETTATVSDRLKSLKVGYEWKCALWDICLGSCLQGQSQGAKTSLLLIGLRSSVSDLIAY